MRGRHIHRHSEKWRRENCRLPEGYVPIPWNRPRKKYKKRQPREILTPGIRRLLAQGLRWVPEEEAPAVRKPSFTLEEEIEQFAGRHPDEDYLKMVRKEIEDDYPWLDCPLIYPWETTEPWSGLPDEWLFF